MTDTLQRHLFAVEVRDNDHPLGNDCSNVDLVSQPLYDYVVQGVEPPGYLVIGALRLEVKEALSASEVAQALHVLCGGIPGFDDVLARYGAFDVVYRTDRPDRLVLNLRSAERRQIPPMVYFEHAG